MNSLLLALTFLAASQAQTPLDSGSDVRFHRIHLRNGNFIDGKVTADKPNEVILLMAAGEMSIRRDQIDRVEVVKMKSYNDKPIVLDAPKSKEVPAPPSTPGAPLDTNTPEAIRKRVDLILFKFKNSPGGDREIPYQDLAALGEEGAIYMASRLPAFDPKTQESIGVALVQLGKLRASAKVAEVLEKLLASEAATVRGVAVTVLGALSDEEGKLKLLRTPLRDSDAQVRIQTLSALGSVERLEWFEPISEACAETDADARSRALRIARNLAEKHGKTEKLSELMSANLRHIDAGVRVDSAVMMGALGEKAFWRGLTAVLGDQEVSVRTAAAQSLMILAVTESGEDLAGALGREKERAVLGYLIGAVQKMRVQKAVEPLIGLLGAADDEIKRLAHTTLRSLTGQTFEADSPTWSEWFHNNRPK